MEKSNTDASILTAHRQKTAALKQSGRSGGQLLILPSLLIIPPDRRFWRVIQISAVNQFAKGYTGESPPPHPLTPPPPTPQIANERDSLKDRGQSKDCLGAERR